MMGGGVLTWYTGIKIKTRTWVDLNLFHVNFDTLTLRHKYIDR